MRFALHFFRDCDKLGLAALARYIAAILLMDSESILDPDHVVDCLQSSADAALDTLKISVEEKFTEN